MLCVSKQFAHDISIHAPRTGSDDNLQSVCVICHISIHAPRTGSDLAYERFVRDLMHISIHAPRTGSDVFVLSQLRRLRIFQSTLPARGATKTSAKDDRLGNFNPRSPHGERLPARLNGGKQAGISIHAPRTGSDVVVKVPICRAAEFQSTLPARGATSARAQLPLRPAHFNPRSPHGERPAQNYNKLSAA